MASTIEKDWTTAAGLRAVCLIIEYTPGIPHHRCGYVEVPEGHPLFGKSYSALDQLLDVHGGLTYSGKPPRGATPRSLGWWFGFDCSHHGDAALGEENTPFVGTVRSLDFVTSECEKLTQQIAELFPYEARLACAQAATVEECAKYADDRALVYGRELRHIATVPPGYVCVSVEPMQEQIDAADAAMWEGGGSVAPGTAAYAVWVNVYKALLTAARKP
jgi:hypothetical protein